MSKSFFLISSEKGGVGKSLTAEILISAARSLGISVAAFDADADNMSLSARLGGAVLVDDKPTIARDGSGKPITPEHPEFMDRAMTSVATYNLKTHPGTIVNSLDCEATIIVHDLPGQSLDGVTRALDFGKGIDGVVEEILSTGRTPVFVHPITADPASTESVAKWVEIQKRSGVFDQVVNLIVLNARDGDPATYPFQVHKVRKTLEQAGAQIMILEAHDPSVLGQINAMGLSVFEAMSDPRISRHGRSLTAKWIRKFSDQLQDLPELFPVPASEQSDDAPAASNDAQSSDAAATETGKRKRA